MISVPLHRIGPSCPVSLTDANRHTTSFAYDGFDRLATTTYPLGSTEAFIYEADGWHLTMRSDLSPQAERGKQKACAEATCSAQAMALAARSRSELRITRITVTVHLIDPPRSGGHPVAMG